MKPENYESHGLFSAPNKPEHTPHIGLLEWFRVGEFERVEQVLDDLARLKVQHLRTGISWADWYTPQGEEWYSWLLPRLASAVEVLPCLVYTPPSLGLRPSTASPPREPKRYADFLDTITQRFGEHFDWVELWNEPNNLSEWDWTLDTEWTIFAETIGGAAYWAKELGKKTVLGGMSPIDPNWLNLMFERGVMEYIDVVGVHGFPSTWEQTWEGWQRELEKVALTLEEHNSSAKIWITETGYSTWQYDEYSQLKTFVEMNHQAVERAYWYSAQDLHPDYPTIDGLYLDKREYFFGLKNVDGSPKLLYRLWAEGGLEAVESLAQQQNQYISQKVKRQPQPKDLSAPVVHRPPADSYVLITGGAGFVGANLADRYLSQGKRVLVYDALSRAGTENNLAWLRRRHGENLLVEIADIRHRHKLHQAVQHAEAVFHFAGQVAVTTSLSAPMADFEVNAQGTLQLLEAARQTNRDVPLLFTSTNKVYGSLEDVTLQPNHTRYIPTDPSVSQRGISEERPIDFHSPYGCSKGAADQYVLDYARSYDMQTALFRMSCIYGPLQRGTEDQGWVAHFLMQALKDETITIFGDGKQVRDILFVKDLVNAFVLARDNIADFAGQAFNIGGGPLNSVSLLELIEMIEELTERPVKVEFDGWRTGDQKYYVTDFGKFAKATDWSPQHSPHQGLERLHGCLSENGNGISTRSEESVHEIGADIESVVSNNGNNGNNQHNASQHSASQHAQNVPVSKNGGNHHRTPDRRNPHPSSARTTQMRTSQKAKRQEPSDAIPARAQVLPPSSAPSSSRGSSTNQKSEGAQ